MFTIDDDIGALIFDCDGTLADTMPVHYQAWEETIARFGKSFPRSKLNSCLGVPTRQIIRNLNKSEGWDLDPEHFSELKEARFRELADAIQPIEPVASLARKYQGRLPMAVVSGGTKRNVDITLKAIGLDQAFAAVLTADDPVEPKPSPEIFLEAARRLGVAPAKCMVFEDGEPGLIAAGKAGMKVIDIRPYCC